MTVELKVHQVREIIRKNLSGNRLKSFAPIPAPGSGTFIIHLRHHPFKVVLRIIDAAGAVTLDVERKVEDLLKEVDRIQVPELIALDESRALVPFRYYLRTHIPGLQWNDVMPLLPPDGRVSLARRCGIMLGVYHGVEADSYREGGIEEGSPSWSAVALDHTMKCLAQVVDRGWIDAEKVGKVKKYLFGSRELLDHDSRPQLTHRRLTPADILVKNEGGEWIATGLLGTGYSSMWDHLWDMAALARQIRDSHPDVFGAFEDSHYEVIARPQDYGGKLEVHTVLETLDHLARSDVKESDVNKFIGRVEKTVGI